MPTSQPVTVTLPAEDWKSIIEIIRSICQSRRGRWILWGQDVNRVITKAISTAPAPNPVKGPKRTAIDKGTVYAIGYDSGSQILEIQFNNGYVHQFYEVSQEDYTDFMQATSPWNYYFSHIRLMFESKIVGREAIQGQNRDTGDEADSDYDQEAYRPYTNRDLRSDLGMDFMSGDEFDSWLDDQG